MSRDEVMQHQHQHQHQEIRELPHHLHVLPPKKQPQRAVAVARDGGLGVVVAPPPPIAKALCLSGPSDQKHFDHAVG